MSQWVSTTTSIPILTKKLTIRRGTPKPPKPTQTVTHTMYTTKPRYSSKLKNSTYQEGKLWNSNLIILRRRMDLDKNLAQKKWMVVRINNINQHNSKQTA
jgi:hypothetical protein